jgi:amidophosphoribosyltransferase
VQELIGADWLIYQDLDDLIAAAAEGNPNIHRFECAVFDGKYITGDVDEIYLKRLELARNDAAKNGNKKKHSDDRQQNLVADLQSDG